MCVAGIGVWARQHRERRAGAFAPTGQRSCDPALSCPHAPRGLMACHKGIDEASECAGCRGACARRPGAGRQRGVHRRVRRRLGRVRLGAVGAASLPTPARAEPAASSRSWTARATRSSRSGRRYEKRGQPGAKGMFFATEGRRARQGRQGGWSARTVAHRAPARGRTGDRSAIAPEPWETGGAEQVTTELNPALKVKTGQVDGKQYLIPEDWAPSRSSTAATR